MEPFTTLLLFIALLLSAYFLKKQSCTKKESESLKSLTYELSSLREEIGGMNVLLASKDKLLQTEQREKCELNALLEQEAEKNRKILSQKKSSEVRTGLIAETLAPLIMKGHNPKNLRWLGSPIDFISFDKDQVTFIEVKSGKSQLSYNQKQIKKLILDKKVEWKEFRIGTKGITSVIGDNKKKL